MTIRLGFPGGKTRRRWAMAAVTVAAIAGVLLVDPSAGHHGRATPPATAVAETSDARPPSSSGTPVETAANRPAPTIAATMDMSAAVLDGVANAAAVDVEQAVAVIDRRTGRFLASHAGDAAFNAESIGKLFTASYYLLEADGMPDAAMRDDLQSLITQSNNDIQTTLWQADIIPTISERYHLDNTDNSPAESPNSWGSDQITADDEAIFLSAMSRDPMVGPFLMSWMRQTEPIGGDGFDQTFGFNTLTGDHGSKQAWSDPGWTPANLHSVGWSDRYFAAILQTSPTATYATMRATSTYTAELIASAR